MTPLITVFIKAGLQPRKPHMMRQSDRCLTHWIGYLWKFGDYKHYTSLKLMTNVLGIPSPKDDIDGSEINRVYYDENDIERIIKYCQKDTIAVAQIMLRLRNEPLLENHEISYI